MDNKTGQKNIMDRLIIWIGSTSSLVLHTFVFIFFLIIGMLEITSWNFVLIALTTAVSLEAIYLAIFIQMTVNKHTASLQEVEEDVEDIQEEIEEISEDVEDITEDDKLDDVRSQHTIETLETLAKNVQKIITDLESLKKKD
ncbi:MAG: hypothetical protein Q8Q37_01210 [bacterium]|nr:hypothetical protein [bacterium]